jgi:hypothetical protein
MPAPTIGKSQLMALLRRKRLVRFSTQEPTFVEWPEGERLAPRALEYLTGCGLPSVEEVFFR